MTVARTVGLSLAASVLVVVEPPRFTAVQPGLLGAGSTLVNAWADYDGDGDLDLFVGFNGAPNRLYRNDGGTLVDVAAAAGMADARATRAGAWGDFDGDGDPDLVVGFAPGPQSVLRLYRNDAGRFVDVTTDARIARDSGAVRQLSWIDYDGDGDLDLFVAFRDRANALFRSDAGKFTDVAADLGLADRRKSVGAVWFDYDEDGDLDLYLANMDGDANALYRNDPSTSLRAGASPAGSAQARHFTDVAAELGVAWGGRTPNDSTNGTVRPCAADVDGDGHLDIVTANYGRNGLFLNRGHGKLDDAASAWGIDIDSRYDTCALDDFDNDGRLDLYVNGTVTGGTSYRDYLLRNTGSRFEDVTPDNVKALQADHGAAWADFDRDGDVDLALTGSRPDGMHLIMRNELDTTVARRSLAVSVVDGRGRALLPGAEVRVYTAGTHQLIGTRLVDTGSGYDAQSLMPVHFGLLTNAKVDVEVTYPHAGKRQVTRVRGVDPRRLVARQLVVKVSVN
jgi:hypothetical protein